MNNFIRLSLGITLALGIPDSEMPLFDYESYDYVNNGIVKPLIGGESEFPAIDNVSFFLFVVCILLNNCLLFLPAVSLDGLLW